MYYYYASKCQTCRWARQFQDAQITAETKSTAHALRKMHKVTVIKSDLQTLTNSLHMVIDPTRRQEILPDTPPDPSGAPF